jgi:hypothetical protein
MFVVTSRTEREALCPTRSAALFSAEVRTTKTSALEQALTESDSRAGIRRPPV